jgi:hypothetical protein
MRLFETEASEASQFDPLRLKNNTWNAYKAGTMQLHCMDCVIARVIAILPNGSKIPTEDWGHLFQWMGPAKDGKPWRVFWFGASAERKFPDHGALAAQHLNGGYTQPCSTRGIFMYRMEEATRVLIHELLHAACLDPPSDSIPFREATVETWAELFLVAYRSKGFRGHAAQLWAQQAQWVADTNHRAEHSHNVRGDKHYGWRYLNGRKGIYESLGIVLPPPSKGPAPTSSRFTHPALGD